MYQIFRSVLANPFTIIIIIVIMLMVFVGVGSMFSSVGTALGFDTKENIKETLVKTENQLDKLLEINKKNEADKELNTAISDITLSKIEEDKIIATDIHKEEAAILELINKEIKAIPHSEPVDAVTPKPITKIVEKIVIRKEIVDKQLTQNQKNSLSLLVDRSKTLKGVDK